MRPPGLYAWRSTAGSSMHCWQNQAARACCCMLLRQRALLPNPADGLVRRTALPCCRMRVLQLDSCQVHWDECHW